MSTHNTFCGEIRKKFTRYPLLSRPMGILLMPEQILPAEVNKQLFHVDWRQDSVMLKFYSG